MNIRTKHYGGTGYTPSKCIEIIIEDFGTTLVAHVTDLSGKVSISLIEDLRKTADELERQNELIQNA